MELTRGIRFATLLHSYRAATGLTQEELAERAGLSTRAISDLERGVRRMPQRETLAMLTQALGLSAEQRALFEAVGRGRPLPANVGQSPEPTPRDNLPLEVTSLVGRASEVAALQALLAETRLLTLVGTGGVGKTRLALRVAAEVVPQFADGVWLVELAPLADLGLVPQAVATVLGLRETPERPLRETLQAALRDRRLLLVLDNCEHVIAACAELATALLRTCSRVQILATSREALRISGETCWRVPSLGLPDLHGPLDPPTLLQSPAVQLFVERARAAEPHVALTAARIAPAIARICHRLDGIPLALELAAARMRGLTVEQVAARLDEDFGLLVGGDRTALPRQQTLRATVEWSYALLDVAEQRVFERLSVFAGHITVEAAEAVCADAEVAEGEVLDVLLRLVDKSLVQAEEGAEGVMAYRLLETLQEYGREQLAARDEAVEVHGRHARYFLTLSEVAAPHLEGKDQARWLARLEAEHDNLRAALTWCVLLGHAPETGLRMAALLGGFWWQRSHISEGRRWLDAALTHTPKASAADRAQAFVSAGWLSFQQRDYESAHTLCEAGLVLYRELDDAQGIITALDYLGAFARDRCDYRQATMLLEEGLTLARTVGNQKWIAHILFVLGSVAHDIGEYSLAAAYCEECLALLRVVEDYGDVSWPLNSLGLIAHRQGVNERARALVEEALDGFREYGNKHGAAVSLETLGLIAHAQGKDQQALVLYADSMMLAQEVGDHIRLAKCLEGVALVGEAQGQPEQAARLLGAAAALRARYGVPLRPNDERIQYEEMLAAIQARLDAEAFVGAWAIGQALPVDQAVACALEVVNVLAPLSQRAAGSGRRPRQ